MALHASEYCGVYPNLARVQNRPLATLDNSLIRAAEIRGLRRSPNHHETYADFHLRVLRISCALIVHFVIGFVGALATELFPAHGPDSLPG